MESESFEDNLKCGHGRPQNGVGGPSFRYEAAEAVYGRQPKNWLSMHKSPLPRISKMNGFCLKCNFNLKKNVGLK